MEQSETTENIVVSCFVFGIVRAQGLALCQAQRWESNKAISASKFFW